MFLQHIYTKNKFCVKNKSKLESLTGFTLMELLVVFSIFMGLTAGIYIGFRNGLLVWKRDADTINTRYVVRIACQRMERDLRCVYFDRNDPRTKFTGKNDGLTHTFVGKDGFIWQGSYYSVNDAPGKTALYLSLSRVWGEQVMESRGINLIKGASRVAFQYFEPNLMQWQDEWRDETALPRAVKVVFEIEGKQEGKDLLAFEKIITLPLADSLDTTRLKR